MKATPLLGAGPTVTTTLPELAPLGTGTTMVEEFQLVGEPGTPLNVTDPGAEPKLAPVIVTDVPNHPDAGETVLITGFVTTEYGNELLDRLPAVTTKFPEVTPDGTGTTMVVEFQLVGEPATPLNITVPGEEPKL